MKAANKRLKANMPEPLPNMDKYLFGLDSNGPETAGVYQNELNLLIHHYKELIKLFRRNQEKKSLALAKARLVYWTGVQKKSKQAHWFQVKAKHKTQRNKKTRK